MPGLRKFLQSSQQKVNRVHLLENNKKTDTPKAPFTVANWLLLKKAIRKLKGVGYQIKFPCVGWAENEIAIEIHCDSGKNTDQAGKHGANL